MPICSPREPVYYYECSAGDFRLVYFIPPESLARLPRGKKILTDFPDGLDLDCTEPDFTDFHDVYGWRPTADPEALQRAFFAIFSSTRGWKKFQGTGSIRAQELEAHVGPVGSELDARNATPAVRPSDVRLKAKERRSLIARRSVTQKALEKMPVEGIDGKLNLRRQGFSKPRMQAQGDSAEEVFSRLHQKRNVKR